MSLKFKDNCLVNEKGNIFPISYESILEECLKHPFDTLSVSTIIFESIRKLTGEKVKRNNTYNSSSLFMRIEKAIQADERYKRVKTLQVSLDQQKRNTTKKEIALYNFYKLGYMSASIRRMKLLK